MKTLKKALEKKTNELESEKAKVVEKIDEICKLGQDWSTAEDQKQKYYDLW